MNRFHLKKMFTFKSLITTKNKIPYHNQELKLLTLRNNNHLIINYKKNQYFQNITAFNQMEQIQRKAKIE